VSLQLTRLYTSLKFINRITHLINLKQIID